MGVSVILRIFVGRRSGCSFSGGSDRDLAVQIANGMSLVDLTFSGMSYDSLLLRRFVEV